MRSIIPKIPLLVLLVLPASAADVKLMWDAPVANPAITNFAVYVSLQPFTNTPTIIKTVGVTNATTCTVSNLNWATTYYFVAVSREGPAESFWSNQASNTTPALPAPVNLRIGP